ncbi:MAG: DUF4157 domain-containing protein [Rhodospirillales bacterium]|nr:MAG: DUF4157 domain-containing protein [Rhodospirillales bacterium]
MKPGLHAPHTARPRFRPGPSRHEAQAVAAAHATGPLTAPPHLDAAPAAARAQGLGPGRPLEAALRREAETAFAADLSAVRVHTGTAGQAARAAGVAAFAAGPDIVVASDGVLAGASGRQLLFHEIAHVLQQTAERGPDGRMRATRRYGTGPRLADGGPLEGVNAPERSNLVAKLIEVHRSGDGGTTDADLEAVITRVSGDFDPEGAGGLALSREVVAGEVAGTGKRTHQLSRRARGLLFDVLKFGGRNLGAATLLSGDIDLPTAALHNPFVRFLATRRDIVAAIYPRIFGEGRRLRQFVTRAYPDAVWNYLMDLPRTVQPIYGFRDYYDGLYAEITDWNVLGRNETSWIGANEIYQFSEAYDATIQRGVREGAHLRSDPMRFKMFMASGIESWAVDQADQLDAVPGLAFLAEGHRTVAAIAHRAQTFWQAAFLRREEVSRLATSARGEAGSVLPESPLVAMVRRELERSALLLLATTGTELPPLAVARANRRTFRQTVEQLIATLDTQIRTLVPRTGELEEDTHVVAGALRLMLPSLLVALDRHNEFTAGASPEMLSDIRLANRIVMARALGVFAHMLRATRLSARVADVLAGRDLRRSTLALLGDWEEDRSTPVTAMRDEVGRGGAHRPLSFTVREGDNVAEFHLPLTVDDLINIYRLFYTRRLADAIQSMLQLPPPAGDPGQQSILGRAYAAARGVDRPMRWRIPSGRFEYVAYADDRRSFRQIVSEHPTTRAQMAARAGPLGSVLYPDDYTGQVFAWVVPSLDPLIDILKRVDVLNDLIREAGYEPVGMTNAQWIEALTYATDDPEALAIILGTIPSTLAGLQEAENTRLATLLPLAVSYERRILMDGIRRRLGDYMRDHLMNYGAPNEVEAGLRSFRRFVTPELLTDPQGREFRHDDAQLAALMLLLSAEIEAAFNPQRISGIDALGRRSETRFDIITGFTPLLRLALRASVPSRIHQVHQIMNGAEISALDLMAARTRLVTVLRAFEATAREMSERLALISTGSALKSNLFASEVAPSAEPFFYDGRPVHIVQIFRPFVFLPAYGSGEEQVSPPTLLDAQRQPIQPSGQVLVQIRIAGGDPIDVTDDLTGANLQLLIFLNEAIANRGFQLSMENLQAVIEASAELMLDVAELVPGAGQVLMAARIVAEVVSFLTSDEFDDMLALARGEPLELLQALLSRLQADLFNPDVIWRFLLFNGTMIDYLQEERPSARRQRVVRRGGAAAKFSRIAQSIGRIPAHVYEGLNKTRSRTVPRVRTIQSFVVSHPRVAFGLDVASKFARGVPVLGISIDSLDDVFRAVDDPQESLDAKLSQLLAAIDQFELPDEPIPNALIIAAMIEFILERLRRMGKVGLALRVILPVLRATGAIDEIGQLIADAVARSAVDPNHYWQRDFKPQVVDAFTTAKGEFVHTANTRLRRFGFAGLPPAEPVGFHDTPFPEMTPDASPMLDDNAEPRPSVAVGHIGPGTPLSKGTLARAGRAFGHDLSPVRLHTGGEAARLTGRYGAHALTSGSHIFLKPGLSPEFGEGARVMRHELAHVLQHTGPRPLGRPGHGSSAPGLGEPGRGLSLDPGKERAADAAATAAAAPGHRLGRPVAVGRYGAASGLAPALGGRLFADILERFTEPADLDAFVREIERAARPGGTATAPGLPRARLIWTQTKAALSDSRKGRFRGHANAAGVPNLIRTYLNSERGAEITDRMIAALAMRAQRPVHGTPGGTGTTASQLDPNAFANVLEAFVFAFAGIALNIRLEGPSAERTVSRVTVYLVDLGRVPNVSGPLWQKALADTPRTRNLSAVDKEILFRMARLSRPYERMLRGREFIFDNSFIDRFESLRGVTAGVSVVPWTEYTTVDAENPGTGTDHRLRLGSHGQLTGLSIADRESHHIPQFVLVEYFRNQAATRMFSSDDERLPGFEETSNPGTFSDGSHTIDLAGLHAGSGRGQGMPAILLAAHTHRTGRLHIGGEGTWTNTNDFGPSPSSQSEQVNRRFRTNAMSRLRAVGAPHGGSGDSDWRQVVDWANQPGHSAVAKPAVFEAMRRTYQWMYRDVMRPALGRALRTEEARFYVAAAQQARGATALDQAHDPAADLRRVDQVMTKVDQMQTSSRYEIRGFRPDV